MGLPSNSAFGQGASPTVQTESLWLWNTSGAVPVVSGFPTGYGGVFSPTKTGLLPADLQNFVGVPIQYYGNPPTPVDPNTMIEWIRWAEDWVEQETSILLCQTWVAGPPALTQAATEANGLAVSPSSSGVQVRGFDYDLEDAAYDFMFKNAQDEAWMIQQLRYRPVQSFTYSPSDYTAVKNISFVYPLLNTFFRVPPGWYVEDRDYGLIRLVPAQNVQMLPLFAMQLAFMGFAENVPGALWFQYTAGLTPFDYAGRYSFMKRLVLCTAAIQALSSIQGTINMGMKAIQTQVDGLQQRFEYDVNGPFDGLIRQFKKQQDAFLESARTKVSGPMISFI
jgi:hypothetical protein